MEGAFVRRIDGLGWASIRAPSSVEEGSSLDCFLDGGHLVFGTYR